MLHQAPFLRITWPVVAGIVCCEFLPLPGWVSLALSVTGLLLLAVYILPGKKFQSVSLKYNTVFGAVVTACLFSTGYLYTFLCAAPVPHWPEGKEIWVKVRLADTPTRREKSYRVEAHVLEYLEDGKTFNTAGKALLYFSNEMDCATWGVGDELSLRLKWNRIQAPKNPGEFNLETYNRRQGIFYRAFVKPEQVGSYIPHTGFSLLGAIQRVERYMLSVSAKYFQSPAEKAVADALILGYKDDLDEETVTRFSRSGTSHVLAVSGLHVGILWLIIDKLLFVLDKRKSGRIFKFILSLGILWGYAMLTGLSPSVLRAAIMFSCFAFSGLLKEGYRSLNILCASAFIQMLVDPLVIFNAGFQLSYAAVGGILVFHPWFKNALYFRHKYARLLWEMVALTLAAQLTTMPISLYWFGQFPTWFVFSNLPLVPLSGLALQLGIAAYVLEWVPYLGGLLFHLFVLSIKSMDALAAFFAGLPFAILHFHVDLWDAFLLYIMITVTSLFFLQKRPVWFKAMLLVSCLYFAGDIVKEWRSDHSQNWVVYSVKNGTVIRRHQGHETWEYKSTGVDRKSYSFSVTPSDRAFNITHVNGVTDENHLLSIGNKKLVLLRPQHLKAHLDTPIPCDWLLVEALRFIDFNALQHNFRFQKLIITGGNSRKSRHYWHRECTKRRIPFYDVQEAGALVLQE